MSVVIPTRNRSALLAAALDSVYAQEGAGSEFDLDVVVVDDASTDATADVVRTYPGARYLRLTTNRGLPAARNAGIAASRAPYVAFLDDDDVWLPRKLATQVPVLEQLADFDVAYSQCVVRFGPRSYVLPDGRWAPTGWVLGALLKQNFGIPVHCYLVRRAALASVGGFDEHLPCLEDYDLWLRLAVRHRFIFEPGPVAIYQVSPQGMNLTHQESGGTVHTLGRILERLLAHLSAATPPELYGEVRSCVECYRGSRLVLAGQVEDARRRFDAAAQQLPSTPYPPRFPHPVARVVGLFAVASSTPLATADLLLREILAGLDRTGMGGTPWVKRIPADVWSEVAMTLTSTSQAKDREAGQAAVRALLRDGRIGGSRRHLLRLAARRVFGRRVDAVLDGAAAQWEKPINRALGR